MQLESYKNYLKYVFVQDRFETELVNPKSRQNVKNTIKKHFFKLMNNTNFGYDCRNNAKFEPIIDEVNKRTYVKKYYDLLNSKISNFLNNDLLEQEIEQIFQQQIANVKRDDPFRFAKINSIKNHNREDLDPFESLEKEKKKK